MVLLYGLFLRLQTGRHSYFFSYTYAQKPQGAEALAAHVAAHDPTHPTGRLAPPLVGIGTGIVLIGLLSKVMAQTLETGLAGTGRRPSWAPDPADHLGQPGDPHRLARRRPTACSRWSTSRSAHRSPRSS